MFVMYTVLNAMLYVNVSCFIVHGCDAVSRRYIYMLAIVIWLMLLI